MSRRRLFPDVPPHVEYTVSEFGNTLLPHVEALISWGQDNFDRIMGNRRKTMGKGM
ncbi:winged helix-turn-helix transcriptional regulator [Xylanibacter rodentium]|uniref:winged helix-turn-helix transcriptional regulator n=1 Tax=Xylanibacter rodentium TaxID=2736289 RepID=UPI002587F887|nr:winged helix-turn-helix transcriptional regulator [Xylanibacter rodentium]